MALGSVLPLTLPGVLSLPEGQHVLAGTAVFSYRYNYSVGGLPFLSAASAQNPIVRESVPIRKNQFDTSNQPGEQSLEGWWLRSQISFHGGAGQDYADPTGYSGFNVDSTPLIRFKTSRNVNVFDRGKVTLLPRADLTDVGAAVVDITGFNYGDGEQAAFAVLSDGSYTITVGPASYPGTISSTQPIQSATTDGSYLYVATTEGIWSAPITASSATALTWTQQYSTPGLDPSAIVKLGYVKQRVMYGAGPSVYEVAPHPTTPPVVLAAPKYTAPDPGWRWVAFTESGGAIYAVGNNTVRGSVLKFVLTSDGSIPVLSGAAVAAQLPAGEIPYSAMGYLGSFVGLGTNKGIRVAVADTNGDLNYGPLLCQTQDPVLSWTAKDRFLYATVSEAIDGYSGLVRVDLSMQVNDLQFPYAFDLTADGDSTTCYAVGHLGDSGRLVFGTDLGLYVESDQLATSGYLQTSRVRFGTLEPKLYKLVKTRGPALLGPVSFQVYDQGDHAAGTFTYPLGRSPGEIEATIPQPTSPQDFISLRFTLQAATGDPTQGGEFWGYQLKALPGVARQRMIQLPLWCFDFERDTKGQRRGGMGSAMRRLSALETLERSGDSILLQDLDTKTNTECVIEQVSFKQTSPPPYLEGVGGIINLTLRTV